MMKKIILPGLIAGVAMLVVGMGLNWIVGSAFPAIAIEYQNPVLFRPWSDPLMNLYFLYPFVLGLILAWFWDMTKNLATGKTPFERAYKFGFVYWVIAGIPGMFITYSSFQVSLAIVLTWLFVGLVNAIVAGWVFAKMAK